MHTYFCYLHWIYKICEINVLLKSDEINSQSNYTTPALHPETVGDLAHVLNGQGSQAQSRVKVPHLDRRELFCYLIKVTTHFTKQHVTSDPL
jgi:hypothetical protein